MNINIKTCDTLIKKNNTFFYKIIDFFNFDDIEIVFPGQNIAHSQKKVSCKLEELGAQEYTANCTL